MSVERSPSAVTRLLNQSACLFILLWGIRITSSILVPFLLGLLLAYAVLPIPMGLMHRFKIGAKSAIVLTVAVLGSFNMLLVWFIYEMYAQLRENMPLYSDRFAALHQQVLALLLTHHIDIRSLSVSKWATAENMLNLSRKILPQAGSLLGAIVLVFLLQMVLLAEMVEEPGNAQGPVAKKLAYYGKDVQRYISTTAKTDLATTLLILVFLVAMGVKFSVLWCVLYFFLFFIPSLGYLFALVPPTLLTLLTAGWQRALAVAAGFFIVQMLSDYGLSPIMMKKGVDVSLLEMMVSFLFWGFLLGPAGVVLAVPLTLALRKLLEKLAEDDCKPN